MIPICRRWNNESVRGRKKRKKNCNSSDISSSQIWYTQRWQSLQHQVAWWPSSNIYSLQSPWGSCSQGNQEVWAYWSLTLQHLQCSKSNHGLFVLEFTLSTRLLLTTISTVEYHSLSNIQAQHCYLILLGDLQSIPTLPLVNSFETSVSMVTWPWSSKHLSRNLLSLTCSTYGMVQNWIYQSLSTCTHSRS